MKLVDLEKLFVIDNGHDLELNKLEKDNNGINYVSRTQKNNGVSAKVKKLDNVEPHKAGSISVTLGGSVLEAFLQNEDFYTSYHMRVLTPRVQMTDNQKLYYCMCIRQNKYKYNFGRQANKSLPKIKVPSMEFIPDWVNDVKLVDLSHLSERFNLDSNIELDLPTWREFKLYPKYFDMEAGKYYPATSYEVGKIPLISSTESNNGTTEFTNLEPAYQGNCITIGKVKCSSFYQKKPFCATADVTVLIPEFDMNVYSGLFIATVLNMEGFKWNYGRQIRLNNCKNLVIKLPSKLNSNGKYVPDFEFMENYIKSLPFSKNI